MGAKIKRYLSVRQVAERLNNAVSVKQIYKLIAVGRLRVNRQLGKLLVEEDSLIELLNGEATPPPRSEAAALPVQPRRRKGQIDLW